MAPLPRSEQPLQAPRIAATAPGCAVTPKKLAGGVIATGAFGSPILLAPPAAAAAVAAGPPAAAAACLEAQEDSPTPDRGLPAPSPAPSRLTQVRRAVLDSIGGHV